MPRTKKMISNKKAIMIETLMRVTISAFFFVGAVIILWRGTSIAGFGSDAPQSFNDLLDKMNSNLFSEGEGKESLLSLDKGTAVIGFSKNVNEYRCYGCPQVGHKQIISENLFYYFIKKPNDKNCINEPCVCLCSGLSEIKKENQVEIICKSFECKQLNGNIPSKISLEEALRQKSINLATYPYWENGFFFVRNKNLDISNGIPQKTDIRKILLFIEKRTVNKELYVAACPQLPCIQEQK